MARSAARDLQAGAADNRGAVPGSSCDADRSGAGGDGAGAACAGTAAAEGGGAGEGRAGTDATEGAGGGRAGGPAPASAADREDFLELMRARFLAGLDDDVDYAVIDADASLDEDLRALEEQDALDQYFDGD